MSPENKDHYESKKEAIHLLLTRIGDEIYSTVDACKTAHDMWIAIEILQQYQKEVNEICAERIAKNANLLALVAAAQHYPDPYYQAPKSHKSFTPPPKQSSSTRSHASIKKPKRLKDYTYHKKKMFMCKQAEKGVPLQVEQVDWLEDTDKEIDEQEFKRQHFEQTESINNTCVVETDDSNVISDSLDMYDNDIQTDQNAKECDDERAALANLITNLTLDTEENKKILKQLKKANASLNQELKECK
nr:hypothetical protein [Tanacetum cinerariifolium]